MRHEADALTGDDVDDEAAAASTSNGQVPDPVEPSGTASADDDPDDWDDADWDDPDDWDDPEPATSAASPYPDAVVTDDPYPDSARRSPYPDEPADADDVAASASSSPYPDADHVSPYPDDQDDDLDDPYDDVDDDPYDRYPDAYDRAGELFEGDPEDFELEFAHADARSRQAGQGDLLVFDEPPGVVPYRPRRMSRMERRRRVKLQARRVRRIIRHVEPWSVLKISLFFYACLWVIFLVAGFMIWGVAESSGTIGKLEDLITDLFALETFDFDAGQIFRGYALGGLALAIAGTTFNVLMCLLFNLISDLTGGLRITMIEEETARPAPPRRARRRRPPVRR